METGPMGSRRESGLKEVRSTREIKVLGKAVQVLESGAWRITQKWVIHLPFIVPLDSVLEQIRA